MRRGAPLVCLAALLGALGLQLPEPRAARRQQPSGSPRALAAVLAQSRGSKGGAENLPGPGEYLVETGYIWPLLGFGLACLLLWRSRQRAPLYDDRQLGHFDTYRQAPYPQVPPSGYSLVPIGQLPARELQPTPSQSETNTAVAHDYEPSRFCEDLKSEGATGARHLATQPSPGPDLMTRMGVMTTRKVIEIQRMLVQELEESLIIKTVSMACLFHTWRCEAATLRVARDFEDDFEKQRDHWEKFLTSQRESCESRLRENDRAIAQGQEKWSRQLGLMMDQWGHGDSKGLKNTALQAWHDLARQQKALRVQRQRVHATVLSWAEGDSCSSLRVCYMNWHQHTLERREAKRRQAELDGARQKWEQFIGDEAAKHATELEAATKALEADRARARHDVALITAKWGLGQELGTLQVTLQTWQHYAHSARSVRRQRQAVHQAVLHYFKDKAAISVRECLVGWKRLMCQERSLRDERKKWEGLLNGEKARFEEEARSQEESVSRRKAAAHCTVELALKRWEIGEVNGLLHQVLSLWSAHISKQHMAGRRRQNVHASILKWALGDTFGEVHNCWIHWKSQAVRGKLARLHEKELKKREDEWESFLADGRTRHKAVVEELTTTAQQQQARTRSLIDHIVAQWQLGHETGLGVNVLRAWSHWVASVRRLSKKRQDVHLALLKSFVSDDRALLAACALNWRMLAKQSKLRQSSEARIAEERERWEEFLASENEACADELQATQTKVEARAMSAQRATELMLRQWFSGDAAGLLASVLSNWLQLKKASASAKKRRQAVQAGILRFLQGECRGSLHKCLLNWKHQAKIDRIYKLEVHERDRIIERLRERTGAMLGKEQTRLLKYARMLGSSEEPVLLVMFLAAWRLQASGIKANEAQRQLEVELEERARSRRIAVTKRQHTAVAMLRFLGMKDNQSLILDCITNWSYQTQQAKQAWAHRLKQSSVVAKYSWYMQTQVAKKDNSAILAACFWEMLREARIARHAREREEMEKAVADSMALILQYQEERNNLEEQLRMAYRQVDTVTETLQKELKTKEELAAELRGAYDKLRKSSTAQRTNITEIYNLHCGAASRTCSTSRPSSAKSDSLPHLPAALLGTPGGPGLSLAQPLVGPKASKGSRSAASDEEEM